MRLAPSISPAAAPAPVRSRRLAVARAALAGLTGTTAIVWGVVARATLLELLVALTAAIVLLAVRAGVGGRGAETPASADELRVAQAIVDAHGRDSLAPFVARPDKSLQFAAGGVLGYRRIAETIVVSGDPVGPVGCEPAAIARLLELCARERATPVVYGASARFLDAYRRAGLHALRAGEEAVVDPASFTLQGRPVRKLRQSVQRVRGRGWTVDAIDGRDVDTALTAEIDDVERRWRSGREQVLGFAMSMGEYEHGARPDDLFLLARAPGGELRAVMRFLGHRGNLSLDTMRRVGETPNGLNEALVCRALEVARERGVPEVSLNYAGLAHVIRQPGGSWIARALRAPVIALLAERFQMERLIRFNDKFSPQWRPRYLVYGSRLALPRSIWRVLQAEGYVTERPATAVSAARREPVAQRAVGRAPVTWSTGR